jgi:predicted N-formylglutamate amidohydrolase
MAGRFPSTATPAPARASVDGTAALDSLAPAPEGWAPADDDSVGVENADGTGPFVLIVDHASNLIPPAFVNLGLSPTDLTRHIAWDPGALPLARALAARLDAPIVFSRVSRLIIDCNREPGDGDLVPVVSEVTAIPGNAGLTADAIALRIARYHAPFHNRIETVLRARSARGRSSALVGVHSFNPVYKGTARPWDVGVLFDDDERLSAPLIAALTADGDVTVGANQPYSPADRVYSTLSRHGSDARLARVMLEIRNDHLTDPAGVRRWAERIGRHLIRLSSAGIEDRGSNEAPG